jgi:hypothetical protein
MKHISRIAIIAMVLFTILTRQTAICQQKPLAIGECGASYVLQTDFDLLAAGHWDWVVAPLVRHYDAHLLLELETYLTSPDPVGIFPPSKHYYITLYQHDYHDFTGPVNYAQGVNLKWLWDEIDTPQFYIASAHWRLHVSISLISSAGDFLDYDEHYTDWVDETVDLNPYPEIPRGGD